MIIEKLKDNLWRFHPGDDVYIAAPEQQLGLSPSPQESSDE